MKKNFIFFGLLISMIAQIDGQNLISFEEEEGYNLGDINGQQGWITTGIGSGNFTQLQKVTDESFKTGTRALKINHQPNVSIQPLPIMGAFYNLDTPLDKSNFNISYSINVDSNPGQNSSTFALECGNLSEEKLVLEIYFAYNGKILILENAVTEFKVTQIGNWEKGNWYDLTISGKDNQVKYYLNGELKYTGELLYNMEELRFAHDNYSGSAYIDDVKISHEALNVNDLKQFDLEIYPNPAKDYINIKGLTNTVQFSIFNAVGEIVKSGFTIGGVIDIKNLPIGMYILNVKHEGENISYKFIKD